MRGGCAWLAGPVSLAAAGSNKHESRPRVLGALLVALGMVFGLEALLFRAGLAGDFDGVVVHGWGDAAEGVRGDPHDFGEVEVGSAELVEPPNELVGVGAAQAEVLPAASGTVSCGTPILPKTAWVRRFFQAVLLKLKGFFRSGRLDPGGFLD